MRITTKYNIGNTVWYMYNNRPTRVIVSAIEIFHAGTNQDTIKYNGKDAINPNTWLDHTNLREDQLFKTKKELLQSL